MFIDVFKLKRNSWHMKLMKRIWNYDHYDFPNMCPYFWLSVLNVFIAPFFFLGVGVKYIIKLIVYGIKISYQKYEDYCDEKQHKWYEEMSEKIREDLKKENPVEKRILKKLYKFGFESRDNTPKETRNLWWRLSSEERDKIYNFGTFIREEEDRKWYEQNERERRAREHKRKVEAEQREKSIARKKAIAKATIIMKQVVKVIAVIALMVVLWLLFKFVSWATTWNWMAFFSFMAFLLKWLFIIIVALVVTVTVAYGLFLLVNYLVCTFGKYCLPCQETRNKIYDALDRFFTPIADVTVKTSKTVAKPFVWFGRGFVYLIQIILALKKDNCPAIEWTDDDE